MPRLPMELILQVVDALVDFPSKVDVPVAIPPSDDRARTLHSFLTVCHAVYSSALRQIYSHCLFIDSSKRLRLLVRTLSEGAPLNPSLQPSISFLHHSSSLYLSPYDSHIIDDLPVSKWIYELFSFIHPTLKRLVIDIPLRSVYPWSDRLSVRPILREAFSRLTNLEEFVSTRDELYLDRYDRDSMVIKDEEVWKQWRHLKKLALYNPNIDSLFADSIKSLDSLEVLVLTRADGEDELEVSIPDLFRKEDDFQHLRILLVNEAGPSRGLDQERHQSSASSSTPSNNQSRGIAEVYDILLDNSDLSSEFYDDPINACQIWMREGAIDGSLWSSWATKREGSVSQG